MIKQWWKSWWWWWHGDDQMLGLEKEEREKRKLKAKMKLDRSFFVLVVVGAESDQHVNICSFAVCCDRTWPNTQWHRVYTGSGNVPYAQFESVGDFIPELRCSKFAVGLQTRESKMGVWEVRSDSGPKGQEWWELRRALSVRTYALFGFRVLEPSREIGSVWCSLESSSFWREHIPFYRWRERLYKR